MQLNKFNGGLNLRQHEAFLAPHEAVLYSNIDNSRESLKSEKSPLFISNNIQGPFYIFRGDTISSENFRDYIEYNNKLYWTEENGVPRFYSQGEEKNLGIAGPVNLPAFEESGDPIFNDQLSQIQGLVVTLVDWEEEDFLLSVSLSEGDIASSTRNYRIFVYDDTHQIFHFDVEQAVNNHKVTFTLAADYNYKLCLLVGEDYLLVAEGKNVLVDNNQSTGDPVTEDFTAETKLSQWTYTFYNSFDDIESIPSELTLEQEVPLVKKVLLSNFSPPQDTQIDRIRVYRLSTGLTEPALVGSFIVRNLDLGSFHYAVTFYDTKLNTGLTSILDTYNNFPPFSDIQHLTEAYGIFFASVGTRLVFSRVGLPYYWPIDNSIDFGYDITAIFPIQNGILVFSSSKVKLLAGDNSSNFSVLPISSEQGCISHRSCRQLRSFPLWVSLDGICTWQNGAPIVLSQAKLGKLDLSIKNTAVYNETYWVLKENGTILAYDLRFGPMFKELFLPFEVKDIGKYGGQFYCSANDNIYEMFKGEELTLHYTSPKYSEGSLTQVKLYNSIYIGYSGVFEVKILVDDNIVAIRTLEGKGVHEIKVPQEKQRGYTLQFNIIGKGEISELEYKPVGRQNGR